MIVFAEFKPTDSSITFHVIVDNMTMEINEKPNHNHDTSARRRKRAAGYIVQFDIEVLFLLDHTIYE